MKQLNVIYMFIVIVLTAAMTYFMTRGTDSNFIQREQQLLNRIDSLNTQIINVRAERVLLDNDIDILNNVVITLKDSIYDAQVQIKKIKHEYDEKLTDIDKYSTDDVAKYFTNRYGK